MPVRRLVGLRRTSCYNEPLLHRCDVHSPHSAVTHPSRAGIYQHTAFLGAGDLLPVRRPGRIVAKIAQPLDTLARSPHHKYASAFSLRTERDALAVRREYRLCVIGCGIPGQVDRVLAAYPLKVDVPITSSSAGVDQ